MTSNTPGIPPVPPPPGAGSPPASGPPPSPNAAQPTARFGQPTYESAGASIGAAPGHPGQYAAGQQAPGQQAPGQQAPGQQAPGQQAQAPGQHTTGQYAQGQYAPGQPNLGQAYPGAAPQAKPTQTAEQLAAKYDAAPISWGKALKPTQLGMFALIAAGIVIVLSVVGPVLSAFLIGTVGLFGFSVVNWIRMALALIAAVAAAVLGGLAFHRSGRRETIALVAGAFGAIEVVLTLLTLVLNFVSAVVYY